MEAALEFLYSLQGWPAYGLVLGLLILCGIGAPMNEDIVLLVAAALTLKGVMDPLPLMLVGWIGIMIGDTLVFHWGHRFGAPLLGSRFFSRIVSPARLVEMQERVRRGGPYFIFVIRFLPGIRTALFFAAGSLKLPYRTLFIYDGAAALIELPLLVYAVRYVGGNWQQIWQTVANAQGDLLAGIAALLLFWLARRWYLNRQLKKRGERA
ncbi:MAG: DedA family protein [Rhodocyclaceae bacterium]|nr:DedA family protein [Rhodocyclaceae bacterium]